MIFHASIFIYFDLVSYVDHLTILFWFKSF